MQRTECSSSSRVRPPCAPPAEAASRTFSASRWLRMRSPCADVSCSSNSSVWNCCPACGIGPPASTITGMSADDADSSVERAARVREIGRGGSGSGGGSNSKWCVTSLQIEACGHVQRGPQRQTMLTGGITPCENGWPGGGGDGPAPACGVGTTSGGTFAPRGCAPWPRSWAPVPPAPLVALLPIPRPPTAGSPVAPQLTAA